MLYSKIASLEAEVFSDSWSAESIEDTLRHDYNRIYYAAGASDRYEILTDAEDCDGEIKILGYIIASYVGDETELLRIAVDNEKRKMGVGKRLMQSYLEDAEKICVSGFLEVRSHNLPAKALYEKTGYKKIATRKNYYREPLEDADIYQINFTK